MEENKIRQSINEYSRTKQGHPYIDYGDDIKIISDEPCPVMCCSVRTQYEARRVYKTIRPHLGGEVGPQTITNIAHVNPWDISINEPSDFEKRNKEYDVKGSQRVETCDTCKGQGQSTCNSCMGKGRETCTSCKGTKKQQCKRCDGTGYVICPDCQGHRIIRCDKCSGKGTIRYKVQEQQHVFNYQTQKDELKYVTVEKTKNCEACHGRGTWQCSTCRGSVRKGYITCKACGNMGYTTCSTCKGTGELVCNSCSGKGKLICATCKGHRQMIQGIAIGQSLDNDVQRQYLGDKRVLDLAMKIQLYGKYLLKERGENLGKDLIPSEPQCNTIINGFFDKAQRNDAKTLFQEAKVMRCPMHFITYTFEGTTYTGIIHNDIFYPNESPINDYASDMLDKAEGKYKRGSSIDALKFLDKAEQAGASQNKIALLREQAERHLDVLYKTGVDLVFWLVALFFTPVLFNFYSNINPVAQWAILSNNPTWVGYKWVAVTQCIVFLIATFILKQGLNERDRTGHRMPSIWAYVLVGMAKYLGLCFIVLLLLMAVNYFGFSILTALAVVIIGWILKIILTIIVWIIVIIKTLIGKIF